jgi:hypothetical protein
MNVAVFVLRTTGRRTFERVIRVGFDGVTYTVMYRIEDRGTRIATVNVEISAEDVIKFEVM